MPDGFGTYILTKNRARRSKMKKKIMIIVSLFYLIINCTPVFATESTQIKYVTAPSGLNIRVKPTTKSKKIAVLPYKAKIATRKCNKKWDKIKLGKSYYYVNKQYVRTKSYKKISVNVKNKSDIHKYWNKRTTKVSYKASNSAAVYSYSYFMRAGVIRWGGYRWTYYSQRVLPGGGLRIPGRHVSGGYVRDKNGYICLSSNDLSKGTVISTPFGSKGKVYDCGVASGTIDVYVQ